MQRKIIHIDCDCFFAACEMKHNKALRNIPLAVGGSLQRGVLSTCNYEARKYGCRSAMPVYQALQKCPNLIIVPGNFELYKRESEAIRRIFADYTQIIEPLSLDEAFLDVSHHYATANDIATDIRLRIRKECRLPASAGIAPNKLLAKIASDWNKPNGQFEIKETDITSFMEKLPVRKLWGIGPKSEANLKAKGITTCGQLQAFSKIEMSQMLGKWGLELYELCRGIDNRPVQPSRIRKSLSVENTYSTNIVTLEDALTHLHQLYEELLIDLKKSAPHKKTNGIFIKITFSDFQKTTVSLAHAPLAWEQYVPLLEQGFQRSTKRIRLLGIGVRFEEAKAEKEQMMFVF